MVGTVDGKSGIALVDTIQASVKACIMEQFLRSASSLERIAALVRLRNGITIVGTEVFPRYRTGERE